MALTGQELMFESVTTLAGLVRRGELSAAELVSCSLERIEALDGDLHAFVQVDAEGALRCAATIAPGDERPFAGVPIAIKNNRAVDGLRLTQGSTSLRDARADYDHSVVRRIREAGFVIVGTTALPEFGILPVTEPRLTGAARNPWDRTRTPGGSSGGSAAAVAAGMVPIAHGNDGGGSLRIPAACCGLVGLKAQRHRVSTAPDLGASPLVIDGVLTRTVAETAALLDLLAGYESGDSAWAPPPPEPFAASAARPPGPLRIAVTTSSPIPQATVEPACAAAVSVAATALEALGHQVFEVDPPWRSERLGPLFGEYFGAQVASGVAYGARMSGAVEPDEHAIETLSYALWRRASAMTAVGFQAIQAELQARMRALVTYLERFDVLVTPALAQRPLPIGSLDAMAPDAMDTFTRSGHFTPFTPIFNASGLPAISIPLLHGDDGLPLGVQLVGRSAGEGQLLALCAQLEAAHPWASRRPA